MLRRRIAYISAFILIFAAEILIALFVHDRFIRPYFGDVLVTVLICCFFRIFLPQGFRFLPVGVFLVAAAVEIGQYFDYAALLGLGDSAFWRILLGSTFSWADLICYAAGCGLFAASEWICLLRR